MLRSLFLLLPVLLLVLPATAQERPDPDEMAVDMLDVLDRQVRLTPEQTEQARPVLQAHADQMAEIMPETMGFMAMMRIRGKLTDLQEQTTAQLLPLLTEAQREDFDGYWKEVRSLMRKRM